MLPVMDASDRITAYIERLGDWRGARLVRIRQVTRAASAELVEEWQREEYPFVARQRVWERADQVVAGGVGMLTGGLRPRRPPHDVLVGRRDDAGRGSGRP